MVDTKPRQVIIAGAGIGGMTAALAFAARGCGVRLFEKASRIEAAGAGIQLSPNATRILDRLGVLTRLRPLAVQPKAVVLKDAGNLRTLAEVPLGESGEERWTAPYLVAHRGDVQDALMTRAAEMPEIELVTGARFQRAVADAHGVTASVHAGNGTLDMNGFLLVGADGVWSSVRAAIPGAAQSHFTGELAWRATIAADSPAGTAFCTIAATDCVTTFLHPGFHLVAYPMRGGDAFNLVAFTKGERIADEWSGKADAGLLGHAMRGTSPALERLAHEAGPWTAWPVHTVAQNQPWTSPPGIALIGDAAHAMTPFAAQGAAMAIEDGDTLAATVAARPDDLAGALASWEKTRKARVAKVARRGALNHLAWHAAGPVALARNLVLRMRKPEKLAADLDWLYGWHAPHETDG